MAKASPRKIEKYGDRFKATAVKLSSLPGVQVKDVAAALDVHPFMLSLWRKQVKERVIVARASKLDVETTAELRRLRELERRYKVLKEEHELLKKVRPVLQHRPTSLIIALRVACDVRTAGSRSRVSMKSGEHPVCTAALRASFHAPQRGR